MKLYRKFTVCLFLFVTGTLSAIVSDWIAPPGIDGKEYGVFYFSKEIELEQIPQRLTIDVSADNRYILYVNGKELSRGPSRSDLNHWNYETVDIAPALQKGTNRLSACVWNFADNRPSGQITERTAFRVACNDERFSTKTAWKVAADKGYSPIPIRAGIEARGGYLSGASEYVDYRLSIPDWQTLPLSDPVWATAETLEFNRIAPWRLKQRQIPFLEQQLKPIGNIRKSKNAGLRFPMTIAPNTQAELIIDHTELTIGHPQLRFSMGNGSTIRLTYLEAPFLPDQRDADGNLIGEGQEKGNRDEIEGKEFVGNFDELIADGGNNRLFAPLWYRCFRYIKVEIETKDEPLTINSFEHLFSAYPFEEKATFKSDDEKLTKIWDISWRTARLCAHETYNDCPYYEQLQYIGDTRIQSLISLVVSGDDKLMRQAIQQFSYSRDKNGMMQAAYPNSGENIIPPFCLYWMGMVYDYYRYCPDKDFVLLQLQYIMPILNWYASHFNPKKRTFAKMPGWHFVDWPDEWAWLKTKGLPQGVEEGESAILWLQFAMAASQMSEILYAFKMPKEAAYYSSIAWSIRSKVHSNCYDQEKGYYADSPKKTEYSQHVNALAILCGMVTGEEAERLAERVMTDKELIQCTTYYRFYLHRALAKIGRSDLFLSNLQPWEEMINLNLTTFAERQEPTRSDCHAWSANPMYELLSGVCGIEPAAPGFERVRIAPNPGHLKKIKASMPHPKGEIKFDYKQKKGKTSVIVILPANCYGEYVTNQKDILSLKPGKNKINY